MMRLYSQKDVDKKALKGARIAVLGYGSQGRAHALNLSDSGFDVVVGVRKKGASWKKAKKEGLAVAEPADAAADADLIAMLVPDLAQKSLYDSVEKSLKKGATLLFAHGFNIHFKQIKPRKDLDVVLIAPKGPGDLVRRQYQQGRGVPCLIAVAQDATGKAHAKALAYAHGIGGTRGGVLDTNGRNVTLANIAPGTRDRVLARARKLGYEPNWIARSLVTRRTHMVGLVIPDLMHSFFAEVAKGVTQRFQPLGYQIVISNSEENPEAEARQIEVLLDRNVDGVIVASAQAHIRAELFRIIEKRETPYVLIDRMPSGFQGHYVGVRDEEIGMVATNHLIEQGCHRIAHLRGPAISNGSPSPAFTVRTPSVAGMC